MYAPRSLLKLDILGALVTSVTVGALFATNVVPTGMPLPALRCMSCAAAVFCATGIFGYTTLSDASDTLRILAVLNSCFCVASGILWVYYYDSLTFWGRIYFPCEIVIVFALVVMEFRACKNTRKKI